MNSNDGVVHQRTLALTIAAVAILCFKFTFIGAFAGPVPFWDEWDAQGLNLFLPYLDGRLGLLDWFAAHNEHRATSARVVWLLTFISTGRWDTIAIMMVNAVIHTAAIVLIARVLSEKTSRNTALAIIASTAILLAVPFGWENSIWSLQTMWYFLLLFSFLALLLLCGSSPFSSRWWLGIALSVCAYFSMSSAVATPMAAAAITLLHMYTRGRRGMREYLVLLSYLALAGVMIFYVPRLNPTEAGGLWTKAVILFNGIVRYASWPLPWSFFSALALNTPALVLGARMIARRPAVGDARWKILALIFWIWIAIAMIAFGRPTGDGGSSRYQDILLVGIAINFGLVLRAVSDVPTPSRTFLIGSIWIAIVTGVLFQYFSKITSRDIIARYNSSFQHVGMVAEYLNRRDDAKLESNGTRLPYPFADRLVVLLSHQGVAKSLRSQVRKDTPGRDRLFWRAVVEAGPFRHFLFVMSPLLLLFSTLLYGVVAFGRARISQNPFPARWPGKLTRRSKDL
jgi:hypothetical protein